MKNLIYSITLFVSIITLPHAKGSVIDGDGNINLPEQLHLGFGFYQKDNIRVDNQFESSASGSSATGEAETLGGLFPNIVYTNGRFQAQINKLTYYLIHKKLFGFAGTIKLFEGDGYNSTGLEERKQSTMAGFSTRILFLTLDYVSDITSNSKGQRIDIMIKKRAKFSDNVSAIFSFGQFIYSEKFTNYYYGVAAEEASTYLAYETKGSNNYKVGMTFNFKFGENYTLRHSSSYLQYDKVIADSPLTNGNKVFLTALILDYRIF